jgi:2-dehydro-3-deoxygluconokinase
MKAVVTFGEVMARLAAPGFLRFQQALPGMLEVTFAGAEANVAASLAMLGAKVRFVSAIPKNPLGDSCLAALRKVGIDTRFLLRSDSGRLGLYFLEMGANQRPSRVTYDRAHSTISLTADDAYDWNAIFADAEWLHVTGITPALSELAKNATISAVQSAKRSGLTVSCDLNFRSKLWRWDGAEDPRKLAQLVMREVLRSVDILIANEEDCGDVLAIHAKGTDVHSGVLSVDRYPDVAREVVRQCPNIRLVATTLRESISASHNNWGAMLYDARHDKARFAPRKDQRYQPYEIRNIVDRVGGGDAFAAGLIFALQEDKSADLQRALDFAAAASCLAHSVLGDFNYVSREEIETLMSGGSSGRVVR